MSFSGSLTLLNPNSSVYYVEEADGFERIFGKNTKWILVTDLGWPDGGIIENMNDMIWHISI